MDDKLATAWLQRARSAAAQPRRCLILASIVEKKPAPRPIAAKGCAVFINRLPRAGMLLRPTRR